jgi:hypothetical protein
MMSVSRMTILSLLAPGAGAAWIGFMLANRALFSGHFRIAQALAITAGGVLPIVGIVCSASVFVRDHNGRQRWIASVGILLSLALLALCVIAILAAAGPAMIG